MNLTVFCSIFRGDKFIDKYLENLKNQTLFDKISCVFVHAEYQNDLYSYKALKKFSLKYKNVKYLKLEYDPGLYSCWNMAVKNSKTEFLSNWNIDDRKPNFGLEILYNKISSDKTLDLIYGYTYISEKENEDYIDNNYIKIYPCAPHSFKNLLINNSPHCMPMWRRDLHDRFGYFDESYSSAADAEMWLRACVNGANIKMINHPVGLYYYNPQGKSTKKETLKEMVEEVENMRQKYKKFL